MTTLTLGARFLSAVDIANRACDHIGSDRIDIGLGFNEVSLRAQLMGSIYDQLRAAELRRNIWRFAERWAVLRQVDTDTRILAPSLWTESTTYFVGSVVSDQTGQIWESVVPDNLGNQPQISNAWKQYFGPMSVSLYDANTAYAQGELVYTIQSQSYTKALLHFEGANGSTLFPDTNSGGSAHTWTAVGNAQISTLQFPFGTSSLLLDGVGDAVTTPDNSDFELGSNDFTIECWVRPNVNGTYKEIAGQDNASFTDNSFDIWKGADNKIGVDVSFGFAGGCSLNGVTPVVSGSWWHVAVVRLGNRLSLYVNGALEASGTITGAVHNSSSVLAIGRIGAVTGNEWNGWIKEFRISVGIARFTAPFSPPTFAYDDHDVGIIGPRVYRSLEDVNADDPATATQWDATVTYRKNQVVTQSSIAYMSRVDLNLNQSPAATFVADWASGLTYAAGAKVTGSDGMIYQSLLAANLGNDPTIDSDHWASLGFLSPWSITFVAGRGSIKWLQIGGTEFPNGVALSQTNILFPIGSGPSNQAKGKNVYRLPANFLRQRSPDPRAGSNSWIGSPTELTYSDWILQGEYLVTQEVGPINFAFVADVIDVFIDPLFCEGLAARIALATCERITQSAEKLKTIAAVYDKFMGEARIVNGIEVGSEQPPLDDFLACRL